MWLGAHVAAAEIAFARVSDTERARKEFAAVAAAKAARTE
jgi:hypothetical protein